jgi:hypothetical protein
VGRPVLAKCWQNSNEDADTLADLCPMLSVAVAGCHCQNSQRAAVSWCDAMNDKGSGKRTPRALAGVEILN